MKYKKPLAALGNLSVGKVLVPEVVARHTSMVEAVDAGFRRTAVGKLSRMGVEVEGGSIVPLAFVDRSAQLPVNNAEMAFFGTSITHMFIRSWAMQTLTEFTQTEVEVVTRHILSPARLAAAYATTPVAATHLASPDIAALLEAHRANALDPQQAARAHAFLASQLYALVGALYLSEGMPAAATVLAERIAPELPKESARAAAA